MAIGNDGAVARQIRRLFDGGTTAGLSEWQLLERFVAGRDEAAFEALVSRFGPMILGVCRRLLSNEADVEDAFQATFLVLVRKAETLGAGDVLGNWLYGVACRVALRARSQAVRRARQRGLDAAIDPASPEVDPGRFELAPLLDEELRRLPTKYRGPIVLCYFEGLTHEEAARRLRWPVGTVKGRLVRARGLLKDRLTRRGLTLSSVAFAATLARVARASVPEALAASTTRAALRLAAGPATAGVISASVASLLEGGLTPMLLTPWKIAAATLIALGLGTGVVAYQAKSPSREPATRAVPGATAGVEPAPATPAPAPPRDEAGDKARSVREHLDEKITMSFANATPLEDVLKYIKAATEGPKDNGIPIYVDPAGLAEAGKTMTTPVEVDVEGAPLKDSLRLVLRPLGLDYRVRDDGLVAISSRALILEEELGALKEELKSVKARLQAIPQATAPRPPAANGATPPAAASGPGRIAEARAATPPRPPAARGTITIRGLRHGDEADPASQVILKKLDMPVAMKFRNETPLEDVLKYIRSNTEGTDMPGGIPIYVDPVGLNEAEKTMTSPVSLDLEGIPLRTTLSLMLKQLGLRYKVEGRLMIITSEPDGKLESVLDDLAEKGERGELGTEEIQALTEQIEALVKLQRARQELFRSKAGIGGLQ